MGCVSVEASLQLAKQDETWEREGLLPRAAIRHMVPALVAVSEEVRMKEIQNRLILSPQELEARIQFFHDRLTAGWYWLFLPILSILAYVGSAILVWWVHQYHQDSKDWDIWSTSVIALWIIGPPAYFFLEYFFMPWVRIEKLPNIEAYKYTREMARNFWLAAIVLLLALATGHFPGGGGE
jgi:hypothetical protein